MKKQITFDASLIGKEGITVERRDGVGDEPKPERWAIVEIIEEYDNEDSCRAAFDKFRINNSSDYYTVIKLAD